MMLPFICKEYTHAQHDYDSSKRPDQRIQVKQHEHMVDADG